MAIPFRLRLDSPGALPQWLAMGLLGLGMARLPLGELISGLAIALALLTLLKLREARSLRERRLVALLQLVCVGLLAALQPELGPTLLQLLITVLALAGLLALELGSGQDGRVLLRRSLQVLASALPMALLLFLLAPRLEPFGVLPWQRGAAAVTGLSENLEPGAIERLVNDRSPAARLAYPNGGGPPPAPERYWRVLVHSDFDGRRWSSRSQSSVALLRDLELLRGLPAGSASDSGAASLGATPTQLWLSEASGLAFVPWSGVGQSLGRELRPQPNGELWHRGPAAQRRVYALTLQGDPDRWRQLPPSPAERRYAAGVNPRLEALGRGWASLPPRQRLAEARRFFRQGGFRYTLQPGLLPDQAPLDAFLFERRAGFCGHYASATAALLRAAELPSRVVSGYRGGSWVVPFNGGGYLDIRQADAHAWIEVWLAEEGWRRLDPSDWISQGSAPRDSQVALGGGPLLWLQRQWWGLDIAWARWWLGYDRQAQDLLLQLLLGQNRQWLGPLLLLGVGAFLAAGLSWLRWLQRRSAGGDRLARELLPLLAALERRQLGPCPGETLAAFGRRVAGARPDLAEDLDALVAIAQRIRYAPPGPQPRDWRALRRLRRRLNRQLKRPAALAGNRRQGLQQSIPAAGP
jgi:transglutaminase-like putative cysteine protease